MYSKVHLLDDAIDITSTLLTNIPSEKTHEVFRVGWRVRPLQKPSILLGEYMTLCTKN